MCVCVRLWWMNERTNERMTFLDDGVKVVVIRPKMTPEKKEIRGSLIFWGKRFGRPEKKYLGLGQPRIIFIFIFVLTKTTFFFF